MVLSLDFYGGIKFKMKALCRATDTACVRRLMRCVWVASGGDTGCATSNAFGQSSNENPVVTTTAHIESKPTPHHARDGDHPFASSMLHVHLRSVASCSRKNVGKMV